MATVALEGSEGTQPGGYGDQVRAVRVQAGDSLVRTSTGPGLGGHGYPARLWAVRASASFDIASSGGEVSHVLGHAVLHLRWMNVRVKVRLIVCLASLLLTFSLLKLYRRRQAGSFLSLLQGQ